MEATIVHAIHAVEHEDDLMEHAAVRVLQVTRETTAIQWTVRHVEWDRVVVDFQVK